MSNSSNRPRVPEGQALLGGHALDGLAHRDPFGVAVIHDTHFLRDPGADVAPAWLTIAADDDATGGFDFHLGVYARF